MKTSVVSFIFFNKFIRMYFMTKYATSTVYEHDHAF